MQIEQLSEKDLIQAFIQDEDSFVSRDRRTCDCELTYVHRKHHAALGEGIEIRLCCMAKFIEEQFNLPEGTFFLALQFEPSWTWDCEQIQVSKKTNPDGSKEVIERKLGPPPRWLRERFERKGIPILNLPEETGDGDYREGAQ